MSYDDNMCLETEGIASMTVLTVVRLGNPILSAVALPVTMPLSVELRRRVSAMRETLAELGGVGLAAPQIGWSARVVVFTVPASRADNPSAPAGGVDGPVPWTVMINPELEPLSSVRIAGWEACLSVPGLAGLVPRFRDIRYRWQDADGRTWERVACGFHARVVQHECDHLDGIVYLQRLEDARNLGFIDELRRHPLPGAPAIAGAAKEEDDRLG